MALTLACAGCIDFALLRTPADAGPRDQGLVDLAGAGDAAAADFAAADFAAADLAPAADLMSLPDLVNPCPGSTDTTPVGSIANCPTTGGNALYLTGGFPVNGTVSVSTGGTFTDSADFDPPGETIKIDVVDAAGTGRYMVEFSSKQLSIPLMTTTYVNVVRKPFAPMCHAGFDIVANSGGCNMESGAFQVHELARTSSSLTFTASFQITCDSQAISGCVHYHR